MVPQQWLLVVEQMMARKLLTKEFINALKTNLVWLRPKYGMSAVVIQESLIQPCQVATMSTE